MSAIIKAGNVQIGAARSVVIQTMWKEAIPAEGSQEYSALQERIEGLAILGCQLLRFAVPDENSAHRLGILARCTRMPLVADIHFDWRLAMICLDYPVAKLRINPGNIGAQWKVAEVLKKARDKAVPIRIGVNAGSLPRDLKDQADSAASIVEAAERELEIFARNAFDQVVVSLKASDIDVCLKANRAFASRFSHPLHIGVTEAGPLISGVARSSFVLTTLLREGIGATLRVSLSDSPENEILAGREIAAMGGLARKGVSIVSCPQCARSTFDTRGFLSRWEKRLYSIDRPFTVAIMGCVVNGPGESAHADIGISGVGNKVMIYRNGVLVRTIESEDVDAAFEEEVSKL